MKAYSRGIYWSRVSEAFETLEMFDFILFYFLQKDFIYLFEREQWGGAENLQQTLC